MLKQLAFSIFLFGCIISAAPERIMYSTVYVFNYAGDKVLLHFHKKFRRWAPPGGKIDPLELPDETAIREAKEETGLDITLYGGKCYGAATTPHMIMPHGIEHYTFNRKDFEAGYNYSEAYDLIYCAFADDTEPLQPVKGESVDLQWVPVEVILNGGFALRDQEFQWIGYLHSLIQTELATALPIVISYE